MLKFDMKIFVNVARLEIGQLFTQGTRRGHPCTLNIFLVSLYNHNFRLVYRHTAYTSSPRRKSQSKEINSREKNNNVHSNSARAKFVNRISCFMRKCLRKKAKM